MAKQESVQWICDKLTSLLQFPVQNDMAEYILSIKTERELDNYCHSLLDIKSPSHKQFMSDLKKRYQSINRKTTQNVVNTDPQKKKAKNQKKEVITATSETATNKTATSETATNKTATNKTATKKTATGKTATNKTATDKTVTSETATNKTATNKTATNKTGTVKNATDKTGTVKTATDKTATDKTATDKTTTDKTAAEKPATDKTTTDETATEKPATDKKKKKQKKYFKVYSDEGQDCEEVFLKGRHKCNCEASKHGLINNCLKCGRIVCRQEGSGPCVVCGELVCTNEEKHLLSYQNSESRKFLKQLSRLTITDNTEKKALEHRNTLLDYDRTSAKRTTIIDDQMDYYSADSGWLTSKQREQLKQKEEEQYEKKHGSRKTKKITIDFAGRQVYEAEESENEIEPILDDEETFPTIINEHLNNPLIKLNIKFDESVIRKTQTPNVNLNTRHLYFNQRFSRVQDTEQMLMVDRGVCLSIHQPYASLLLLNIKSHEGRTWFTAHRGRLWIASTAQKPSEEDIERVETFYKNLKGENVEFPKKYPTGCLMGCVNVMDCLSQEEYIEQHPEGENESPFIFICTEPKIMITHFPIKGQNKIFKLDEKIHHAAQKCLMKEAY